MLAKPGCRQAFSSYITRIADTPLCSMLLMGAICTPEALDDEGDVHLHTVLGLQHDQTSNKSGII